MSAGVFLMARGWMDTPALSENDPFSRREAWIWMVEQAAYAERKISIAGKTVTLVRGQFSHSLRFMAKAWGWEEPKVRRFIGRLKTDALIDAATDAGQLVVTLCDYCKIQGALSASDAPYDAASDAVATQDRRSSDAKKNEGNEINEGNEGSEIMSISPIFDEFPNPSAPLPAISVPSVFTLVPPSLPTGVLGESKPKGRKPDKDALADDMVGFEEFWRACPKRQAKPVARQAYAAAVKRGVSAGQLLIAIRRYAEQERAKGTEDHFIKTPGPWLNAERYLDEYPADPIDGGQIRSPPQSRSAKPTASYLQAIRNISARLEEQV
ncbi:MAG: hypothetical protein JWO51_164 [Rhodospirillales bacterium]|nr:hypothetical protein [Rhodospirillales bacterium]